MLNHRNLHYGAECARQGMSAENGDAGMGQMRMPA